MIGDNSFLPITHVSSANLPSTSGNLPFKDVLVCQDIAKSILSVFKLTNDYPCSFKFYSNGVCVKDKKTKKLLTLGKNSKGLYVLGDLKFEVFYSSR